MKAIDNHYNTSWSVGEMPASVEFTLTKEESFNVLMLQEQIALGQRVEKFRGRGDVRWTMERDCFINNYWI